ncbi:unnamed protein product, partial [Closterium sp. NIES-54]
MPTAFKFYPDSYFPSTSFPCPNLFVTLSLQRLLYATDSSPTALLRFLPAQATTPAMDNAATSAHPPAAATAGAAAADCRMALATQGRLLPLRVRQLASHVMIEYRKKELRRWDEGVQASEAKARSERERERQRQTEDAAKQQQGAGGRGRKRGRDGWGGERGKGGAGKGRRGVGRGWEEERAGVKEACWRVHIRLSEDAVAKAFACLPASRFPDPPAAIHQAVKAAVQSHLDTWHMERTGKACGAGDLVHLMHVDINRDPTTGTCQGSCACVHVELARPALRGLARRGRGREGRGAGREEEEAEAGEDEGRWGALFDLEALRDVVVPSVLNTLVAGSTGIQAARIQWQDGDDSNSSSNSGGHLALATSLSSSRAVWPSIAAACAAADCSDSIDWTKSRPEGLQQIADSLGIEAARSVLFH